LEGKRFAEVFISEHAVWALRARFAPGGEEGFRLKGE
jgi:hypothetical protein